MNTRTKQLVYAALFIALAFVGANIKIMGSIAFDSLPAFVATLVLGWGWGAVIAFIAHLLTAALSGFPLTLPAHIITAFMMAATMIAFYFTIKFCADRNMNLILAYVLGCVAAVIFNVPLGLLATAPIFTLPVALGLIPALLPAAILNVVIAVVIYAFLPSRFHTLPAPHVKKNDKTHQ
ncbi:MAG: ECF transporter S component [Eubacteriaceae bacterium]|jgi:riboflavin transporter FmnP|nr:ECF transporter S component [Eubacteriaceae bacterium]MDD4508062.1 ECF transporter S component [Eubacteriaceae bacterium]